MDLFGEIRHLKLNGGTVVYDPRPSLGLSPDLLMKRLSSELVWEQHKVRIHDTVIDQPRLSGWHGDIVHTYTTLAHNLHPEPWSPVLKELRQRVSELAKAPFNSMLANLYRNGADSIGWHSDNEEGLGTEPTIALISLGAERKFSLRRWDDHRSRCDIILEHGSLLIMSGMTQRYWQHAVPRTSAVTGARISLTFRQIDPVSGRSLKSVTHKEQSGTDP